jgi:hypothetical protein
MTAGGSVRAIESAKDSLYNAFIGLAIVVLRRVLANLVGGALGAACGGLIMPIVYEVPTHLNVSDTIVFGLDAHQLVRLAAEGSLGYLVWDQANVLTPEVRATVACLFVAAGLACARLQPGGRPLERWVVAQYLAFPRQFT